MDVKPPAAADAISRPSPPPARPSRVIVATRRAGIALVGIGVAALAAAACVLSFEDLHRLALAGEAPARFAYLYPAAFDALLAIALISAVLLRGGRRVARLQAGVVLVLLFAGAAAAEVATATRATVDVRRAAIVVAVAPWVALTLALWLWFLLIGHAATRRASVDATTSGRDGDIVPFPEAPETLEVPELREVSGAPDADLPTAEYPVRRGHAVPPPRPAAPGHSYPPGSSPAAPSPAEVTLDPRAAPPLESAPHHDLPAAVPVVDPTPAPETPEITESPAPAEAPGPPEVSEPVRPVRWGDLIRPRQGDLLVHPPRGAVRETPGREAVPDDAPGREDRQAGEDPSPAAREDRGPQMSDRDADTQPMGVVGKGSASSRRARGTGPADLSDSPAGGDAAGSGEIRADAPRAAVDDEEGSPPPFGRVRSTPTPPEE